MLFKVVVLVSLAALWLWVSFQHVNDMDARYYYRVLGYPPGIGTRVPISEIETAAKQCKSTIVQRVSQSCFLTDLTEPQATTPDHTVTDYTAKDHTAKDHTAKDHTVTDHTPDCILWRGLFHHIEEARLHLKNATRKAIYDLGEKDYFHLLSLTKPTQPKVAKEAHTLLSNELQQLISIFECHDSLLLTEPKIYSALELIHTSDIRILECTVIAEKQREIDEAYRALGQTQLQAIGEVREFADLSFISSPLKLDYSNAFRYLGPIFVALGVTYYIIYWPAQQHQGEDDEKEA